MRDLDLLQRFSLKTIGWKNWVQKLLEVVKTPNESNQNQKHNYQKRERPVSEQPPGSLTKEIGKDILFGCESTNSRTVRPVNASFFSQSCVLMSVERVDKRQRRRRKRNRRRSNKNGETCKWTTNRFVHSARGNRHWLQECLDRHMQLWNKQRTSVFANSWRRSRVILIEKHFKPTCSKISSTTHSVTLRKQWFVKWAM